MKFYGIPKITSFVKFVFLLNFISLSSKGQVTQKDSLKVSLHEQYVNYVTKANASLGAGVFFEGVGAAALLIPNTSPAMIITAVAAFTIGAIALIDSYFLRRKANRLLLRRQKALQEKFDHS